MATPVPFMSPMPFGFFGPTLGDVVVGSVIGSVLDGAIRGAVNSGPSSSDRLLEQQQRQDERQIDQNAATIEALKREIQELKNASGRKEDPKGALLLEVKVPSGKEAGQTMLVKAPNGSPCEVKVPEGLHEGQSFQVQVPVS